MVSVRFIDRQEETKMSIEVADPRAPIPPSQTQDAPRPNADPGHPLERQWIADQARAGLAAALSAYCLGVPVRDILSRTRGAAAAAHARQLAMYLCHTAFEMSITRASIAFGRDRSTIAHACHRIEDLRDDPLKDRWIEAMESLLRMAPDPAPMVVEEAAP
jgi:hypothetical protein